jgi:uncharacterized protein (TIGR01777 family)
MKVVIAGGTGFIGSYLQKRFQADGDDVIIVSRDINYVQWNHAELLAAVNGSDILINLAGYSVNCKHNSANKKLILHSRIETTTMLGEAIKACECPPLLWINASASGIYQSSLITCHSEKSTLFADSFLGNVVQRWESTFFEFSNPAVRQVVLRTAVVLGSEGGAFPLLSKLTRLGLGGRTGSGKQLLSWIHYEDYYGALKFVIKNNDINGIVNCTSPDAVTNSEFMKALRSSVKVKIGIFAPEFAIRIASKVLNFDPDLVLSSSWLYPEVLLKAGFRFKYPDLEGALKDLVHSD